METKRKAEALSGFRISLPDFLDFILLFGKTSLVVNKKFGCVLERVLCCLGIFSPAGFGFFPVPRASKQASKQASNEAP